MQTLAAGGGVGFGPEERYESEYNIRFAELEDALEAVFGGG